MAKTTPVACILTPVDLAVRGERWHQLTARAMTERAETADGLRIWFRPEGRGRTARPGRLGDRVLPWATWTVERDAGTIVLDVRSTYEGVATSEVCWRAAAAPGEQPGPQAAARESGAGASGPGPSARSRWWYGRAG